MKNHFTESAFLAIHGTSPRTHLTVFVSRAAVRNDHKLGGLKQQKIILSQSRRPEVPSRGVSRATRPTKCQDDPSPPLPASGGPSVPWLVAGSLPSLHLPSHDLLFCLKEIVYHWAEDPPK